MIDPTFLSQHPLFQGLSREELEKVAGYFSEEEFKAGTTIMREGEITNGIYFLVSGKAKVRKKSRNADGFKDLFELKGGDAFGELEFLDIQPAAASILATEDTKVILLTNRNLYAIKNYNLQTFTMIVLNLSREISRKLRNMDELASN